MDVGWMYGHERIIPKGTCARRPLLEKDGRDYKDRHASRTDRCATPSYQSAATGIEELARTLEKAEENGVYRFYHGSYKVFHLQRPVKKAFALIKEIGGEADPPHFGYARIVEARTAHDFQEERTNANWDVETKPILEAFWHTKCFVNMMVKYAKELEKVEMPLDYGMAAVLYLFELR